MVMEDVYEVGDPLAKICKYIIYHSRSRYVIYHAGQIVPQGWRVTKVTHMHLNILGVFLVCNSQVTLLLVI